MTETPGQPETPPPPEPYGQGYGQGQAVPPPAPPPMPYGSAPPPPVSPRNGMGITALILAIIGLLLCWIPIFGTVAAGILGILAVIFGFLGRGRAKRGEATNSGVALAGIILGFLSILAAVVSIVLWFLLFKSVGFSSYMDCMNSAGNDTTAQQKCSDEFQHHIETQFSVTLTDTPTP
ncbi:MAG TPA: DUF4190 domain-containing protein [Mycobacterium sp.]|nr:DUF4190 domain-containing protein [Mycobacterium sp.]